MRSIGTLVGTIGGNPRYGLVVCLALHLPCSFNLPYDKPSRVLDSTMHTVSHLRAWWWSRRLSWWSSLSLPSFPWSRLRGHIQSIPISSDVSILVFWSSTRCPTWHLLRVYQALFLFELCGHFFLYSSCYTLLEVCRHWTCHLLHHLIHLLR